MLCLFSLVLWMFSPAAFAAPAYHGQVTFNGVPVPGATVTATQADKKEVSITDQQGTYVFSDITDGAWKFQVEMQGFETLTQDVTVSTAAAGPTLELKLLSLADITHGVPPIQAENELSASKAASSNNSAAPPNTATLVAPEAPESASNANAPKPPANAKNNAASASNTPPPAAPPEQPGDSNSGSTQASSDLQQSAATGLVVNGSVNNGAASPFSQAASFGNNRRGPGLFYNGNAGVNFDTSAWDARNFSPGGLGGPKPSYNQLSFLANIGGPIGIPRHYFTNSNFVLNYQHGANDSASAVTGLVPTLFERGGNFSQSVNSLGQPVVVYNPATNLPYASNAVPISAQGQALLQQYPMPNVSNVPGINYEASGLTNQHFDALQSRLSKYKNRNQFFGNFDYQHQASQNDANIFGYQNGSNSQGIDGAVSWQHVYRPGGLGYLTTNFKYEFNRLASSQNPFFAFRTDVSGDAGIQGNDQSPAYWGPPNLGFTSVAGLSLPEYAHNANNTQTFTYSSLWYRGKHSLQFGVDVARLQFNANTQQNGRGIFSFTGAATQQLDANGNPVPGTGSDLADFLIGVPDGAEIAFGNADKYLRGWRYDAYVTDDWRMKAGFTINAGLRWEFATPLTELGNRLANLDVAPNFSMAAPVVAATPTGPITSQKYPNSLLHSDFRGVEPRVAIAWRPRSNSPLIVRAGYGIYDITSVYQVIAMQMAQQPPFSKSFNLANSAATPLTLAGAFNTSSSATALPTFGVDPNFRIGYAQVWNASVQQDIPGSMVLTATYTGTRGSHLMQEFMPNMYPVGSPLACPSCPAGFVYLTSNAFLNREAARIQLRRRLRNGLTATLEYSYAKATDDASAFSGSAIASGGSSVSTVQSSGGGGSASIAQNWQNLRAEMSRSAFDQRHLITFTGQYTTGEGLHAGALMSGWKGTVFKDWTFLTSLTFGSGLPLTPIYQSSATAIGAPWIIRPDVTGASITAAPAGKNLNAAAFAAPAAGDFGDAARYSITGPRQFSLDASISRTFRINTRMDATWETRATNVLNTVTDSTWNTNWNSPAFGTVAGWNGMRKLSTTIRVRF
ncbi:MAG TPA: carboxypeptidase-like regulatory domain-containing protein [Candidatus Acidoferrales bacterium]|nr:carboxypeptidase-like regulatory domain-containing protein [Candidatus Acidoferrales bacterium]